MADNQVEQIPDRDNHNHPAMLHVGGTPEDDVDELALALGRCLHLSSVDHSVKIMEEPSLHRSHIYCVIHQLNAQRYGPLLEKYIIAKHSFTRNTPECLSGDCSKNGFNYEIKISLGGSKHKKFNYVQVRPSHNIQFYILTSYYLDDENITLHGILFIFKISSDDMKRLLVTFGGYAHGTKRKHGPISMDKLNNTVDNCEYALRTTYGDKCWKALMPYRVDESAI